MFNLLGENKIKTGRFEKKVKSFLKGHSILQTQKFVYEIFCYMIALSSAQEEAEAIL